MKLKITAIILAVTFAACLSACKINLGSVTTVSGGNSENSISNTNSENLQNTGAESDTVSEQGSASAESAQHKHLYSASVTPATCTAEGYTEYKCQCGDSYIGSRVPKSFHNFVSSKKTVGGITYNTYVCTVCGEEAFAHGNADGSLSGGNNRVKFYVTGKVAATGGIKKSDYHIVIYGQGAMPDFAKDEEPMWQDYLYDAVKITVASGITTIGSYAFNCPGGTTKITFDMADSVKTIKANSINLNMQSITLGKGVERIEEKITGKNMTGIYLPKTLKYFGGLGSSWKTDTVIYFEGTKEQFLNIQTRYYNKTTTLNNLFDSVYKNGRTSPYCQVFVNCKKIFDTTEKYNTMEGR